MLDNLGHADLAVLHIQTGEIETGGKACHGNRVVADLSHHHALAVDVVEGDNLNGNFRLDADVVHCRVGIDGDTVLFIVADGDGQEVGSGARHNIVAERRVVVANLAGGEVDTTDVHGPC